MKQPNITLQRKTILITGVAGFIGANLAKRLLTDLPDSTIVGIDNMNDYYDVRLKEADFGYKPSTPLRSGLRHFAEWYARYYGIKE